MCINIICKQEPQFKLLVCIGLEITFLCKKFDKGIINKTFRNINRALTLEINEVKLGVRGV